MKLFLIDAYALIYRSYYAFIKNPRVNSKGMNTSAIFGFINSLEDVLKREPYITKEGEYVDVVERKIAVDKIKAFED